MSNVKYQSYDLTDDELLKLDGIATHPKTIQAIRILKDSRAMDPSLTDSQRLFLSKVKVAAEENQQIICRPTYMRSCGICGQSGKYGVHKRNSKYHRKGERNSNDFKPLSGYELVDSFVVMENYPNLGICSSCFPILQPFIAKALENVRAQVSSKITGKPLSKVRVSKCKCSKCGWEGVEAEMRPARTVMGDGWFFSGCPMCSATNFGFNREIETSGRGYEVIDIGLLSDDARKVLRLS